MCDIATVAFGIQNTLPNVKVALAAFAFFLWFSACGRVAAAWFYPGDGELLLRGAIEQGDDARLAAQLKARPDLRVLRLDSYGGSVKGAIALGEAVRRARLATVVDAARDVCDSACTMIFAAGATRHYLHAGDLREGLSGLAGLGYHRSYLRGDRTQPPMLSAEGERLMIGYYRRMGAAAAVTLSRRGTISSFWRPNGATALRLGLATSLAPPAAGGAKVSPPSSRRISGSPATASASAPTSRAN